ncbi:hypothetical protein [Parvimonas parva]|uniref:PqqD family protein n=1 Tax=Parvimonas parva TaxID=2769485 RepID=A0ABS1C7I5_9FIRM|nr:hypothetical protein [Parvimonas parva]MBK1468020.1 hypothetical protein [Parvimonas parva]
MRIIINNDIFYRFEPNIDNGTLIVFFKDTNKIYELTKPYYIYLTGLENSYKNIEELFLSEYNDLSVHEVKKYISLIENKLFEIGVLVLL